MELTELRVFLQVATERSFSRAAMKLHRTQPAVSQSVRRLEESVGERLFDRATKDATLTDAGRLLRDYADRLVRLSEEKIGRWSQGAAFSADSNTLVVQNMVEKDLWVYRIELDQQRLLVGDLYRQV